MESYVKIIVSLFNLCTQAEGNWLRRSRECTGSYKTTGALCVQRNFEVRVILLCTYFWHIRNYRAGSVAGRNAYYYSNAADYVCGKILLNGTRLKTSFATFAKTRPNVSSYGD